MNDHRQRITPDTAERALLAQTPTLSVDGCRHGVVTSWPVARVRLLMQSATEIGWDLQPPPSLEGFELYVIHHDVQYRFAVTAPAREETSR